MGTPTETVLARRWVVQINMGTDTTPDWQTGPATTNFVYKHPPVNQDDSDYDSGGWGSSTKTAQNWSAEWTINRKATPDSTAYSAVHEHVRTAALSFGSASKVGVRWYDRDGLPEAYQGTALVDWEPSGGDRTALETTKITMTGVGALVPITNPVTP